MSAVSRRARRELSQRARGDTGALAGIEGDALGSSGMGTFRDNASSNSPAVRVVGHYGTADADNSSWLNQCPRSWPRDLSRSPLVFDRYHRGTNVVGSTSGKGRLATPVNWSVARRATHRGTSRAGQ